MMSTTNQITRLSRPACLVATALMLAGTAQAQLSVKRQKYDGIAAKYKNEHAVYTDVTERLVISDEDGTLDANSYVTMEKLYISDLSLNRNNKDFFSYGQLYPLTNYDGYSYIPDKYDYKKVQNSAFGEGGFGNQTFYDDQRVVEAFYTGLSKKAITVTNYSNNYSDLHMLDGFEFKQRIPVVQQSFEVVAPAYVKMGFSVQGMDTDKISRSVTEKDGKIIYRFTAANMPAIKSYNGVPDVSYYMPHVIPYIVSYRLAGAKKDSIMAGTMEEMYSFEYKFLKDINLRTDTGINNKVAELTRNAYSDRDKAARIYEWVQKNMHYIAFEDGLGGFIPRPADTVYKRMYGDCKDMASILQAMCRRAGLKAYFTLIGSNSKAYTHDQVPLAYMFNHMICAVNINDEWIFLDGTDRYLPLGANRRDLQGKEALIAIDKRNYKIVTIPSVSADRNTSSETLTMNIENNDVKGTVSQSYSGYNAWDFQHELSMINKKDDKDRFARAITGQGAYGYVSPRHNISTAETGDMGMNVDADYTMPGYAQKVGKQYFVNMNMKNSMADMRINDADRKVPYYYDYRGTKKETVVLNIPDGYKVTYLPKDAQGGNPGELTYKISYRADAAAKKVTLTKEYNLEAMTVSPKQFEDHNRIVDDLRKQYKETVVLTAKK